MENINLIIAVGCKNDFVNEINLVDELENKVLCHCFDTLLQIPTTYLDGKPKRALLYHRLFKHPVTNPKPETNYDFISHLFNSNSIKERDIIPKPYRYDNFLVIEHLINLQDNKVYLVYTDDYLPDIITLLKRINLSNLYILKKQT